MRNPFPDVEAIMLWSIPEFAIAILKYCHASLGNSDGMRGVNLSCFHGGMIYAHELATHIGRLAVGADTATYKDQHSPQVANKTMAAISWLETKGYLAPEHEAGTWRVKWITPAGEEVAQADPDIPLPDVSLIPREKLHPKLRDAAWGDFVRGEYSTAVFKAYLQVEIALRDKSGIKKNGKRLVTSAFSTKSGTLQVNSEYESDQEATMMLFSGAISLFRNAAGHNIVEYDDPERAVREFQLADLLLRMLDEIKISDV